MRESGRSRRVVRDTWLPVRGRDAILQRVGPGRVGGTHRNVNVLENLLALDAAPAVGGLDQVVTGAPSMLPAERIDKLKGGGELPGLDQETRAVDVPI